jgi:uncharacterized protein
LLPISEAALATAADGVRVSVRLLPRARSDRIIGVADGRLRISVTALPVDNAANEALLRLLAKAWRLRRSDLSIASGATSRNKIVHITGEPAALQARLAALIAPPP